MLEILDWQLLVSVFVTLFVIMDPPGTVPIFLALTSSMTRVQRKRAALQAVLVAFAVIAVFAVFGKQVLDYMHVSIPALQASGGLLLLLVAMELLTGKMENPEPSPNKQVNVALVPLGTPLLAGPGAIVATMVAVANADGPAQWGSVGVALVAVCVCLWLSMRFAGLIRRLLRESGTILVSRIAGLLLAAIAVQMIADAVLAFVAQAR